jgi:peptidoglycan hydrolase-like protein with peptidoglycan-binding domain
METLRWPVLRKDPHTEKEDVRAAQFLLWCARDELNLEPDGKFGDDTYDAVVWFQKKAHLEPTGVIDENTWVKMTDGTTIPGSWVKRGSGKGHCVGAAQTELRKHGLYHGDIDGDFGENTERAVRMFQEKLTIPENLVVGKETWRNLICRSHI